MKTSFLHILIFGILVLLLGTAIPTVVWAQLTDTTNTGQRGAPRIYKYDARTAALGDATVADAANISVININPAGLSFVREVNVFQANISQNWNNNVMLENFTLPALRFQNHTMAAQFAIHHDRGLETLNFLGANPMPQPQITMYQLDVAYSYSIDNVISFGVLGNISFAKNSIGQYWTLYPTLGILYTPSESLSYGMAFRGLGRSITYLVNNPSRTTLGTQNLRESLELGATLRFPVDTDKSYLSLSLANEKQFGQEGIWYKAGLEVTKIPYVALRTGMLFYPEDDLYAPRFGIGILTDLLKLDYSVSYKKELFERYHQLGITLHLDKF